MSNYGVFESAMTDDHDEQVEAQKREMALQAAIFDAKEQFGDFLSAAKDKSDFKDRVALVKNDMMKVVASSLMPVPGVMRKVEGALKPDFNARVRVAAPGPETTYAEAMAHPTYREATDRNLLEMAAQNSSIDLKVVRGIVRDSYDMNPFEETYNLQFGGNADPNRAHINWNPGNIPQMPHTYYYPVGWYVQVYPEGKILAEGVSSVHEAIRILESSDSFAGEQMSLFSKRKKTAAGLDEFENMLRANWGASFNEFLNEFDEESQRDAREEFKNTFGVTDADLNGFLPSIGASRKQATKCPKCDGMGRETYEKDSGSLSTQTCTECGGTGEAKEASRKQAGTRETGDAHADAMKALRGSVQDFVVDAIDNAVKSGEYVWNYDPEVPNVIGLQSRMGNSNEAFVVAYLGGDDGFDDFEVDEGWLMGLKGSSKKTAAYADDWRQKEILDAYYNGELAPRIKGIEFDENPYNVTRRFWLLVRARGKQKIWVPASGEWSGAGGRGKGLRDLKRFLDNWGKNSSKKEAADYSGHSYDQLVDEYDTLRQQYADWETDQSEYRDSLAEIEAEAERRGLTLASRKQANVHEWGDAQDQFSFWLEDEYGIEHDEDAPEGALEEYLQEMPHMRKHFSSKMAPDGNGQAYRESLSFSEQVDAEDQFEYDQEISDFYSSKRKQAEVSPRLQRTIDQFIRDGERKDPSGLFSTFTRAPSDSISPVMFQWHVHAVDDQVHEFKVYMEENDSGTHGFDIFFQTRVKSESGNPGGVQNISFSGGTSIGDAATHAVMTLHKIKELGWKAGGGYSSTQNRWEQENRHRFSRKTAEYEDGDFWEGDENPVYADPVELEDWIDEDEEW